MLQILRQISLNVIFELFTNLLEINIVLCFMLLSIRRNVCYDIEVLSANVINAIYRWLLVV